VLWQFLGRFRQHLSAAGGFALLAFVLVFVSLIRVDVRDATSASLGAQALFEFVLQGVAAGVLVLALAAGRISIRFTPALVFWVIFGAFATVSALWAPQPQLSALKGVQLIALCVLTAVVATQFTSRRQAVQFLGWLTALGLGGAILLHAVTRGPASLWQAYEMGRERLTVLSIHPLVLGGFAGAVALLVLVHRPRGLGWALPLGLAAVTVLSGSRAPTVLLAALVLCWAMLQRSSPRGGRLWARAYVLALATTLVGVLLVLGAGQARLPSLTGEMSAKDIRSLNGRVPLWQATLERADAESESGMGVFAGYGFASFRHFGLDQFAYAGEAHNALIQVFAELGIVGLLLWLLAVGTCFAAVWSSSTDLRSRLLGVLPLVYLLGIQMMDSSLADSRSFVLLVLLFYSHAATSRSAEARFQDGADMVPRRTSAAAGTWPAADGAALPQGHNATLRSAG
jgi:O-antigen ligase